MALTIPNPFPSPMPVHTTLSSPRLPITRRPQISCSSNRNPKNKKKSKPLNDSQIASDFARQARKTKTQIADRETAMKMSREILFHEMCVYMGMKGDDLRQIWRGMGEEEKKLLVDGFVGSDWCVDFRPVSARWVMDLVDEYVGKEGEEEKGAEGLEKGDGDGGGGFWVAWLRKLMGLEWAR